MENTGTSGSTDSNAGNTSGKSAEEIQAAFDPSGDKPVLFTDSAVQAVKAAITSDGQEGDGLRVSVIGGGCSGYQYNLDFEREARMGDVAMDYDGVTIYIDPVSAGYLKGTVIDYVSGLQGTGFKFINPNAKRTCGCGSSFA